MYNALIYAAVNKQNLSHSKNVLSNRGTVI